MFVENANLGKLTSMHFYGWKKGLKTGMYYLRTKSAVDAIKFTVQKQSKAQMEPVVAESAEVQEFTPEEQLACSIDNPEDCVSCGS